jgi:RHS repeat-associated protein
MPKVAPPACSNLSSNGTCASPTSGTPTYSHTYDRFGNRLNQTGPITFDATFTGNNNRLDGYSYDSAGNLLNDGFSTYSYDAENRIIQVVNINGTATYTYDANGRRVHRTGYTATTCTSGEVMDYVYDLSNRWILQVNNGGTSCGDEVYAGGRHLGSNRGGMAFSHSDWLGTERVRIPYAYINYPQYWEHCSSLPFGDGLSCTPAGTDPGPYTSPLHFTGKERDGESGLDNFGARYDASSMGRFITPDWSAAPMGVPYGTFTDPQSLDLYSYVRNNPLNAVDRDGHSHEECSPDTFEWSTKTGAYVLQAGACHQVADFWDYFHVGPSRWSNAVNTPKARAIAGRVVRGGEGFVNLGMARIKLALAEELAGECEMVLPCLGAGYVGYSAAGSATTGMVEITTAITGGDENTEKAIDAVQAVSTGSGLLIMSTGGDVQTAKKWAAIEGVVTADPKDLMEGKVYQKITKIVDFLLTAKDAIAPDK